MVEQPRQRNELLSAPSTFVGTVVNLLLMNRRVEMLVESDSLVEFPVAQITFPVIAVISLICHGISKVDLLVPPDLLVGDDPVHIALLEHAMDRLAVHIFGLGARAGLKMVRETTR